jgi:hypothetical protein
MLGQLTTAHGLTARVEGPEALSTTNVFQLETTGVMIAAGPEFSGIGTDTQLGHCLYWRSQ